MTATTHCAAPGQPSEDGQRADLSGSLRPDATGGGGTATGTAGGFDAAEAERFLLLLGIDPADAWFRNIRPGKAPNSCRSGRDLQGFDPVALAADVAAGESLYLVTGNASQATGVSKRTGKPTGCVQDSDVESCSTLFIEWDDRPIEWQLIAWQELGLPEPTAQVFTGGASVHNYWALEAPMDPTEWRVLQSRLIDLAGSDEKLKNPSRLMRLPGAPYFDKATGLATGRAEIVHESGKRYSATELADALPGLPQVPRVEHSAPHIPRASTRSTASDLPPRDLDQIRLAAQFIPQRVPGASKAGGSQARGGYEPSRRALCGCSAALAEIGISDPDAMALDLLADRWPDRATAQQVLYSSSTRDSAAFWAIAGEYGYNTRRSGAREQQDAAVDGFPDHDAAEPIPAPFKVLGWDADRKHVFYRHRQTSQIATVKPYGPAELLKMAPADYWQAEHPRINELGKIIGTAWTAAASWLIERANGAGVFDAGSVRGRGVWLEPGGRVVWHLGDRLEVNGAITTIGDHDGAHPYARLPALQVNPDVQPLDDDHGRAVLQVIKAMGWAGQSDWLHVAGWAVTGNVCGAIPKRPGLQGENQFGSGKTDLIENVLAPLQAGIGIRTSGSTEAGVRQLLGSDALPATIDESEQEDPRKREAQVRLVRHAYDATPIVKGTPGGRATTFYVRSSLALAGINAPIPNPADRSRIAVVTRRTIPGEQWADVAARRAELITDEIGNRLIRRTVTHLPALLANIATFGRVIAAMATGRAGDTWGALLAGAHHLTSTAVLTDAEAGAWLQSVGWDYSHTNSDDSDRADGAEGRQCLDHLLAHELRWRVALNPESDGPSTDAITIRELVAMVRENARSEEGREAIKALGRKGIKVTPEGLAVAHNAPGTAAIFRSSKWTNSAHRQRLLELPGVAATAGTVHFPTDTSRRAVLVPWALLGDPGDQHKERPAPAAAPAPPPEAPAAAPPAPVTFDRYPPVEPPLEWTERFLKIAGRSPRPPAAVIAAELAPEGEIEGSTVARWLKWFDALADEFSDAA
jgi:hypothetical protein